jgi:hypothetical protein
MLTSLGDPQDEPKGSTMIDVDSIASLTTRREVRRFLSQGLNDLIADQAEPASASRASWSCDGQ